MRDADQLHGFRDPAFWIARPEVIPRHNVFQPVPQEEGRLDQALILDVRMRIIERTSHDLPPSNQLGAS